jgi:UDP-glucose:(galactosyl)LPS alpha-1,2-glucosyltransferase
MKLVYNINFKMYSTPLVIAFTPNYFIPAATCLFSVLKHSEPSDKYEVIVLLSESLPQKMTQKLQQLGDGCMTFRFINLKGQLSDIYVDKKYTVAASYRLLLPELLPEYDKILYVDCDIIVRNNLAQLFNSVDLKDNYLAGVYESTLDFQIPHLNNIGCKSGKYINSGFLIMNLAKMRQDKMVTKFIEASKADYLEFPDQDVLNVVCKGQIMGLPPYYNSIRTFYLPQYKKFFLQKYTEQNWEAVQSHGTIHYTGAKPWDRFTVEFSIWWRYYDALPKEIKKGEMINKRMYALYKLYDSFIGGLLINGSLFLYRKMRY